MKKIKNYIFNNIKTIVVTIIAVALFIFFSWLAREYSEELSNSAFSNMYGELIYFGISVLSVMITGLSSSPLIPLALTIWGAPATVLLTAFGFTTGSLAAFFLSRKYGETLICRLVNKCDFDVYRNKIKNKGLFLNILIARIFLPVDIISYALGLFTRMSWISFGIATFIGSIIFTIIAIFAASLTIKFQIILFTILIFIFFFLIQKYIRSIIIK